MNVTKGKKIAIYSFCFFLFFMAVCTVITKGIYRSGLPKVSTQVPYSMSMVHEIQAKGTVRQGEEYGVFVEEGLRIAAVSVRNGDYFGVDTPLFRIDIDDLQRMIEKKELEMEKLRGIQNEEDRIENESKKQQQLHLIRVKEDYENVAKEADANVERCEVALDVAKQELVLYETYLAEMSQAEYSVSTGNAMHDDYTQRYNQQENRYQLEQEIILCDLALKDAMQDKAVKLQAAQRSIEDAEIELNSINRSNISNTANELDILYQEKEIERLKELYEADGWIYSDCAGRIIECNIDVGTRIKDEACILFALDEGERIVEAVFTEGSGSYLAQNALLNLETGMADGSRMKIQVNLGYMEVMNNGDTLIEIAVNNRDLNIGQQVDLSYSVQTDTYMTCVPALCIHDDGQGSCYVYVAEEREGIWGTEWIARKVSISILDQTDTMVAIKSAEISSDTRIVTSVSKQLEDGDVVRMMQY